jgi:opacity protein-like surface antigen
MRPLALRVSTLLVSLAVAAPTAGAQRPMALESPRLVRIGVGGGVSVPTGDFKKAFDNGYNAQAFLQIKPPGLPVSLRVTGTFNRFDLKDVQVGTGGETNGYGQIAGGLANATVHLPLGPISPYIMAGLGALNFKTSVESGSTDVTDSETKFAINGGAGLAIKLGRMDAYVEGRVANVYTEKGARDFKTVEYIPVTFGIIF